MPLSRRDFLKLGTLITTSAALSSCAPVYRKLAGDLSNIAWTPLNQFDFLALNRLTFGPRVEERNRFAEIGLKTWIEEQLDFESINDLSCDIQLSTFKTLSMDANELEGISNGLFDSYDRDKVPNELRQATLIRQLYSKRQLYEIMVEFLISPREFAKLPAQRYVGGVAKTKKGNISYVDSQTMLHGLKEMFIDEIYKVKTWSRSQPVVIDCGANIGLSALFFANNYNAKVYAVEADPNIFKALSANSSQCQKGVIEPINKAVWINDDGVTFDVEGGYSGQIHQHGNDLVKSTIQIPSLRLRNLLTELQTIDMLKLDIEGAENKVIFDCENELHRINYIFIEYHSNSQDPQLLGEILNVLKKAGFRYHVKEAFTSKTPFDKIEEMGGMDLQLNLYAVNQKFNGA